MGLSLLLVICWLFYEFRHAVFENLKSKVNIEELTAVLCRDIKRPLTDIMIHSNLVVKKLSQNETVDSVQSSMDKIQNASQFIATIGNDLHEIAGLEAGTMVIDRKKVKIEELISEVLDAGSPLSKKKSIVFERNFSYRGPSTFCDSERMKKVLTQFIEVAALGSPDQGKVAVSTDYYTGGVRVGVGDSGAGIAEAQLPFVFLRKKSEIIDDRKTAIGFGLCLCRQIVLAHGGAIWAESQLGLGTKYYFSLPNISGPFKSGAET